MNERMNDEQIITIHTALHVTLHVIASHWGGVVVLVLAVILRMLSILVIIRFEEQCFVS